MQKFEVTILGCSSATPTSKRNPTAQLVNIAERFFLVDCGEATQIQLRRYKIKFQRIDHIFISHLHGDHYLGLMGLISSFHLLGRKKELHIYCPAELQEIIEVQFKHSQTQLNYQIIYHHHKYINDEILFEDNKIIVKSILLNHRIPCCGFVFYEKLQSLNVHREYIVKYNISISEIQKIKKGEDYITADGVKIPNEELVKKRTLPRKYAFCSDTCYDESIIPYIINADLLYHEATFLKDMEARAVQTFHSTAQQAATIAKKSNVKKLMIGHYSARYKNVEPLLLEAKEVFEKTILAIEGQTISISSE